MIDFLIIFIFIVKYALLIFLYFKIINIIQLSFFPIMSLDQTVK